MDELQGCWADPEYESCYGRPIKRSVACMRRGDCKRCPNANGQKVFIKLERSK